MTVKLIRFRVAVVIKNKELVFLLLQGDVEVFANQIYLGVENNTKSGVRSGFSPQPIVEAQTAGILNCNISTGFWISWNGTERRVGSGSIVSLNTFLTWVDDSWSLVSTIGFSNAHQAGAHYFIRRNAGKNISSNAALAFTTF